MGMNPFSSGNRASESIGEKFNTCTPLCSCNKNKETNDPNPRADNFEIKAATSVGFYLITTVKYPNCTTYNGIKVLVYEGISKEEFWSWTLIDPHFLENKNFISPIARFPGDGVGILRAIKFASMLDSERNEQIQAKMLDNERMKENEI